MRYQSEFAEVPVRFRVERRHEFDRGFVEVRRYFWGQPVSQKLHAMRDVVVLNRALTSRPEHTRVDRIEGIANPLAGDAGRLLVMIPGMPYQLVSPSGTLRCIHCAIELSKFESISESAIDWSALESFGGETRPSAGIDGHLSRIYEELMHDGLGSAQAIQACIDMICVELVRRFRQRPLEKATVHVGGLATWRMRLILKRVHEEGPAPRVAELAELTSLTERQLSRAFKAETGLTIGQFVGEVTMDRAHRLLTTTHLPMAQIARSLGYSSADSFAQSFRRFTGASPAKVRRP